MARSSSAEVLAYAKQQFLDIARQANDAREDIRDGRSYAAQVLDGIILQAKQNAKALGNHLAVADYKDNPSLVVWGNPGRTLPVQFDQTLSERAYELAYLHVDDDQDYKHKFAKGVQVTTVLIGDRATTRHQTRGVLLYRPDGRDLWKDF